MTVELEIPRTLPVESLSVSSVTTYIKCPERWRRRYVEREYEPPSGAMLLGSSVGAAEADADHTQIETGERPLTEEVQDLFADEWSERTERDEVDWGRDKPGDLKDMGIKVVKAYDAQIAPHVKPISVEREFRLDLAHVDWGFKGYLDLEEEDGAVVDRKVKGTRLSPRDADVDVQATAYLLARRAEGNPAPAFKFHTMVKVKTPYAEVVPTVRTDVQLDSFVNRLYSIAAEIHWRMETGNWAGAVPGSWWCGERFCGFWDSCSMGGLR